MALSPSMPLFRGLPAFRIDFVVCVQVEEEVGVAGGMAKLQVVPERNRNVLLLEEKETKESVNSEQFQLILHVCKCYSMM